MSKPIAIRKGAVFTQRHQQTGAGAAAAADHAAPVCVAGWICFVLSVLLFWLFPVAAILWLVALIMAIVALAKGDLGGGLMLLIGVLLGPIVIAVLLALGVAGLGALAS